MASGNAYYDDITPSEPPPSYAEALNSPPVQPPRPSSNGNYLRPSQAPPMPSRPGNQTQLGQHGGGLSQTSGLSQSGHQGQASGLDQSQSALYSNNPTLPFQYPRGYFCQKCKNTGFKIKNGKVCHSCWDSLYLRKNAYNPNPNLPFRYPRGFICDKCRNTGYKLKNGRSCQDCYDHFARSNYLVTLTWNPFGFSSTDIVQPINYGPAAGPPVRVPPGDPRLGGTLCGKCRGSGQVTFFLDLDLCPVCGGLGRILNGPPQHIGYR